MEKANQYLSIGPYSPLTIRNYLAGNPLLKLIAWTHETELLDDREFSKTFKNCIESLPVKWSSAVHLKYLKDHDTNIICSELEITPSDFWQMMHREKLHLRNCLELKWFKK